jgi:hypothetical protein
MKKSLLTLALVAATVAAFGQGKVQFGNDSNHYFVLGDTMAPDSGLGGGTSSTNGNTSSGTAGAIPISPLPSGYSLEAVLYAGQTSSSMTLQTAVVLTGANWLSAGRMANKGVTLPFPGGTPAFFQIFVVDTTTILPTPTNSLPSPGLAGPYFGSSGLFTATPGTSISFPGLVSGTPASSTWAPGNLVIGLIPEPTSFSMMGLCSLAMLIYRRRKARIRV